MPDPFDGLPPVEPSAATGFSGGGLEHRSENRGHSAVAEALAKSRARLYLFAGVEALLKDGDPQFTVIEAERLGAVRNDIVLLGWHDGAPRLAAMVPEAGEAVQIEPVERRDLRSLAIEGEIAGDLLGQLALARSLTGWHGRHRYCANCGAATTMAAGGFRRDCATCGAHHFPRTDPVVIMLAVDGERALLGRSARFTPGMYSCLAGFMEPGETIEEAVRRETGEESGIRIGRVRYLASQPWPFPSSLMIGCLAEALTIDITLDDDELEDCRWFDRGDVLAMLAGAHPDGLRTPPTMAIANLIIRTWTNA